jgi:hypothetical protein
LVVTRNEPWNEILNPWRGRNIVYNTPKKLRQLAIVAGVASAAATAAACSRDLPLQPTASLAARNVVPGDGRLSANDAGDAAQNKLLATIRQSTARYHRVEAALADGYVLGSPCEAMPGQGIGIHYRKATLFDAVVDPSQPELLVYEPRENGNRDLVAVAFVVRASAWDPTHNSPPMLGNQVFEDKRVPDWSSPPFPNYEVHVWVWKNNPNGMYATTNPTVSCDAVAH